MHAQKTDLSYEMFTALIEDKDEFVSLFIEVGVVLETFLTPHRLYDLYKEVCIWMQNLSLKTFLTWLYDIIVSGWSCMVWLWSALFLVI